MTANRRGVPTPTQRLLACAEQIARHYDLPQAEEIHAFAREPEPFGMRRLSNALLGTARLELTRTREAQTEGFDAALSLARYAITGATIAHTLRTAATADSSAAPSQEAWELLAALTTMLYRRAKDANTTYELTLFYATLAESVPEADPGL